MTASNVAELGVASGESRTAVPAPARPRPAPRPPETGWAATGRDRDAVWTRLTSPPFAPLATGGRHASDYTLGLGLLLDWLAEQPGTTWQDRWLISGADADGRSWRQIPASWLREHGHPAQGHSEAFTRALLVAISADLIRPSLTWLATAAFRRGSLVNVLARSRDDEGFARLRALCSTDPDVAPAAATAPPTAAP